MIAKPFIITQNMDDVYDKFWRKQPRSRIKIDLSEFEDEIAKSPEHSCSYAKYIICKPFPKGEAAIYSNTFTAGIYTHFLESLHDNI